MNRLEPYWDEHTQLLLQVRGGNAEGFERLCVVFRPIIGSFITRCDGSMKHHDVEDMVEEVLTRVWEYRERFRGDASAKTYILGIAKNVLHEEQLRRDKHPASGVADLNYLADILTSHTSIGKAGPDRNEISKTVKQAIAKLPPIQRKAIELVYIQNLTTTEAAKLAGCTPEQLADSLYLARKRLKNLLKRLS